MSVEKLPEISGEVFIHNFISDVAAPINDFFYVAFECNNFLVSL